MDDTIHISSKCLELGSSSIGSKTRSVHGDVIDEIAKQKLNDLPEGMLEKIEDYLRDRFPEVYSHNLNKIISVPDDYDYGVEKAKGKKATWKARAMQYGDEREARKRIAELANAKTMEDKSERRRLEQLLDEQKPFKCEDDTNRRLKNFFKNEPGLFLRGFKPKEYFKEIKKIAIYLGRGSRKSRNTPAKLVKLEVRVLELLGIKEEEVYQWVDES